MDPWNAVIILSLVGFLLVTAEVFVPGMVLGILGGLCLVGSTVTAYVAFGPIVGTYVLAVLGVLCLLGFAGWMKYFPHTSIGRKVILQQTLQSGEGHKPRTLSGLVGRAGEALTPLRPAGTALIEGRRVDVVAENEMIASGEPVIVVAEEGFRVVVRKSAGPAPVSP